MLPRWADQVTAELKLPVPVTVAANCAWALEFTDKVAGLAATVVTTGGTTTVRLAVAVTPAVYMLVAVTTSAPPVAGAVYSPALVMLPRWADQVTAELKLPVPVTVVAN